MSVSMRAIGAATFCAAAFMSAPSAAVAQDGAQDAAQASQDISIPSMPLEKALKEIERQSGVTVKYDPYAVPGVTAKAVQSAKSAEAAIREAIADSGLSVFTQDDGSLGVGNTIVVTAQRDEAETSILVRNNSTSNRNGTALRDQPRNAQVISSKLIDEQQATTVRDALRYAGGVSGGIDGAMGQTAFYVRGFPVTPLNNGMAGATGALGGVGGSVDIVERIEVLKGPDALLAGNGNLGGIVNVVTKKPSAAFFAEAVGEVGINFADYKVTGDVNGALTDNNLISARVIGSVRGGDETYGGYDAASGYTFAPSIRYKNERTDILVSATITDEFVPITPAAIIPIGATKPLDFPRDTPLLGTDQGLDFKSQRYFIDASHNFTQKLSATLRYQHQYTNVTPKAYSFFDVDAAGDAFVFTGNNKQVGPSDAFDGFVRGEFTLGPIRNTMNVGFNYVNSVTNTLTGDGAFLPFNVLNGDVSALPAPPTSFRQTLRIAFEQRGYYAQNQMALGPVTVVAGVRRTDFTSTLVLFPDEFFGVTEETSTTFKDGATTFNAGVVVDVIPALSVFANYMQGFDPTLDTAFDGSLLPNIRSTNREAGVKIDLFRDLGLLNLSYFQNDQSNTLFPDRINGAPFVVAGPGVRAEGFDINYSGQILPGWTVIASFTRTNYRERSEERAAEFIVGNARDTYSAYSNYTFKLGRDAMGSLGAGITGRSSAFASRQGDVVSPAARQVDLNASVLVHGLSVRLGVRNLLNRENFDVSFIGSQLPISEPRNVRLTVGYRF